MCAHTQCKTVAYKQKHFRKLVIYLELGGQLFPTNRNNNKDVMLNT